MYQLKNKLAYGVEGYISKQAVIYPEIENSFFFSQLDRMADERNEISMQVAIACVKFEISRLLPKERRKRLKIEVYPRDDGGFTVLVTDGVKVIVGAAVNTEKEKDDQVKLYREKYNLPEELPAVEEKEQPQDNG